MDKNYTDVIGIEYTSNTNELYNYIRKNKLSKKLFERISNDNRNEVIESMLPLVFSMAKNKIRTIHIEKNYCNIDDLINVGVIGLIKGVDLFIAKKMSDDVSKSVSTYCYFWIEKSIKEYLMSYNCDVKKLVNSYENKTPIYNESSLKIVVEDINEDGDVKTDIVDVDKTNEYSEDVKKLTDKLFSNVSLLQKKIIFLHFGIGVEKPISLVNIASMFKLTYKKCSHEYEVGMYRLRKNKDFCEQILELKELIKLD